MSKKTNNILNCMEINDLLNRYKKKLNLPVKLHVQVYKAAKFNVF